jgi:hypothetical protein
MKVVVDKRRWSFADGMAWMDEIRLRKRPRLSGPRWHLSQWPNARGVKILSHAILDRL